MGVLLSRSSQGSGFIKPFMNNQNLGNQGAPLILKSGLGFGV